MTGPVFTSAQFLSALQKLMPPGYVWPRDPDAVQTQVLSALVPTYAREVQAANALLNDSPAFNLDAMLPEWEETLGLPDPCAGEAQTVQQRVAQVIAKFSQSGGQSKAFFIALAGALGYPNVTITEYAPFRAGISTAGGLVADASWAFAWTITSPTVPAIYFTAGHGSAGDPLYSLNNGVLKCNIDERSPAHTVTLYGGYT
jgi:uncharacterized protein YmfQ (DUF2313 family)